MTKRTRILLLIAGTAALLYFILRGKAIEQSKFGGFGGGKFGGAGASGSW